MIRINFNGSKWAGEPPDDLETLFDRLKKHKLDKRFKPFAKTVKGELGQVVFFGNFEDVSHTFSVTTDEPDLIARFIAAIKAN